MSGTIARILMFIGPVLAVPIGLITVGVDIYITIKLWPNLFLMFIATPVITTVGWLVATAVVMACYGLARLMSPTTVAELAAESA